MSDVTKSWRPYRIEKYNSDLAKLIHGIEETMNPFNTDANDKLFYNVTGKHVPDDIRDNIIQYRELGNEWCQEFITGCSEDPARFEKPIRRRKMKTFSQAATNSNIRGKDERLMEFRKCEINLYLLIHKLQIKSPAPPPSMYLIIKVCAKMLVNM